MLSHAASEEKPLSEYTQQELIKLLKTGKQEVVFKSAFLQQKKMLKADKFDSQTITLLGFLCRTHPQFKQEVVQLRDDLLKTLLREKVTKAKVQTLQSLNMNLGFNELEKSIPLLKKLYKGSKEHKALAEMMYPTMYHTLIKNKAFHICSDHTKSPAIEMKGIEKHYKTGKKEAEVDKNQVAARAAEHAINLTKIYNGAKRTKEAKEFQKLFLAKFNNKYVTYLFETAHLIASQRPVRKHTVEFCQVFETATPDSREMYIEGDDKPLYVGKHARLTHKAIAEARANLNVMGQFYLSITFTASGTEKFFKLTEELIGKRLAIIVDGKLRTAPNIIEPISAGRANISGKFKLDELINLANGLNSQSK